jgi:hypothetical protein
VIWQYVFALCVMWAWLVALLFGRLEDDLHSFVARYVRYMTHFYAYVFLLADPYPRFRGFEGTYPVDVAIDPPERQSRWVTFFRLLLAIPALVFAAVLMTVLEVTAIAGWFVALVLGRMPRGMRDLGAYCLRFNTQTYAYVCLLTSRYPSLASGAAPVTEPAALDGDDEAIPPRSP